MPTSPELEHETDQRPVNVSEPGDRTDADDMTLSPPLRADSTLSVAVAAFDEYMIRKGFSANTIKAFRNDLKIFVSFMSEDTLLHQITTQHLEDFLAWLQHDRGRPCSAKTLARRITTLKVFFGWLHGIGVLGTGAQARLQVQYLAPLFETRDVVAWGRDRQRLEEYRSDMTAAGYEVLAAESPARVAALSQIIVTTTPTTEPLLRAADIRPGTHINAIGSDTTEKQELEADVLGLADVVVGDSLEQCLTRGEISRALAAGTVEPREPIELGVLLAGEATGRTATEQITVFDSTGVAVQDIAMATAIVEAVADG